MSSPFNNEVLEYFLDIVFENSFCRCQGNNGCTRGCRLAALLDKDRYPPVRKCMGKKSIRNSFSNCARHVTGAIMAVAHDFLVNHCENSYRKIIENIAGYQQCVEAISKLPSYILNYHIILSAIIEQAQ